jgi:hypothetical protein
MTHRKQRLYLSLAGLLLVLLAAGLYLWLRGRGGAPAQPPSSGGEPPPALVANNQLPTSALLSQATIEASSKVPTGGRRIATQLLQWGAYIKQEQGAKVTSYYVAPGRMVWLLKEAYPRYAYRHGSMTDATVTRVYDAQTGRLLHLQVRGKPESTLFNR